MGQLPAQADADSHRCHQFVRVALGRRFARESGRTLRAADPDPLVGAFGPFHVAQQGVHLVERELAIQSNSNIQLVDRISQYIQLSGGKRIRPALLLLCAQMCGYEGPVCSKLGAVVELIHSATLVHDDIIDDAKVRRGRASVNAQWGNEITVLMGDWLYMTSFQMALGERHFKILDILTDVTRKMIEGELIQLSVNGSRGRGNSFVVDGSSHVSASCQNPTWTIMALAWRSCDYLADEFRKGNL